MKERGREGNEGGGKLLSIFVLAGISALAAKFLRFFEGNDPQEVKIAKNTCSEGTSLAETASFEPSCVRIGCVVLAVDRRKKKKIHT